jgi:hypothetical protein
MKRIRQPVVKLGGIVPQKIRRLEWAQGSEFQQACSIPAARTPDALLYYFVDHS